MELSTEHKKNKKEEVEMREKSNKREATTTSTCHMSTVSEVDSFILCFMCWNSFSFDTCVYLHAYDHYHMNELKICKIIEEIRKSRKNKTKI